MGPLERQAMQVLWSGGELSVREVMLRLPQRRAYTTVMTTLARLFTKRILKRRARDRRFLYSPRITDEWQQQAARATTARFLTTPDTPRELLVSCLLATVALKDYRGFRSRTYKKRPTNKRGYRCSA